MWLTVYLINKQGYVRYWLPNPFRPPQSGHCQLILLQVMPHRFSCMQVWQI